MTSKKYKSSIQKEKRNEKNKTEAENNANMCEIEEILDHAPASAKRGSKDLCYRVKWKLDPNQIVDSSEEINWITATGMFCNDMLDEYWKNRNEAPAAKDQNNISDAESNVIKSRRSARLSTAEKRNVIKGETLTAPQNEIKQENNDEIAPVTARAVTPPISARTRKSLTNRFLIDPLEMMDSAKKRKLSSSIKKINNPKKDIKTPKNNEADLRIKEEFSDFDIEPITPKVAKKRTSTTREKNVPQKKSYTKANVKSSKKKRSVLHQITENKISMQLRSETKKQKTFRKAKASSHQKQDFQSKIERLKNIVKRSATNLHVQKLRTHNDVYSQTDTLQNNLPFPWQNLEHQVVEDGIFPGETIFESVEEGESQPHNTGSHIVPVSSSLSDNLKSDTNDVTQEADKDMYNRLLPYLSRFSSECWERKYGALKNKLKPIHVLYFFESPKGEQEQDWSMTVFENSLGEEEQYVCECVPTLELWKIARELVTAAERRFKLAIEELQ